MVVSLGQHNSVRCHRNSRDEAWTVGQGAGSASETGFMYNGILGVAMEREDGLSPVNDTVNDWFVGIDPGRKFDGKKIPGYYQNSVGWIKESGSAVYYVGLSMAMLKQPPMNFNFISNNPNTLAGALPSQANPPAAALASLDAWKNKTDPSVRWLKAEWDSTQDHKAETTVTVSALSTVPPGGNPPGGHAIEEWY